MKTYEQIGIKIDFKKISGGLLKMLPGTTKELILTELRLELLHRFAPLFNGNPDTIIGRVFQIDGGETVTTTLPKIVEEIVTDIVQHGQGKLGPISLSKLAKGEG